MCKFITLTVVSYLFLVYLVTILNFGDSLFSVSVITGVLGKLRDRGEAEYHDIHDDRRRRYRGALIKAANG